MARAQAAPSVGVIWTPTKTYTLASWQPVKTTTDLFGVRWLSGRWAIAGGTDSVGVATTGLVGSLGLSIDSSHAIDLGLWGHVDQGSKPTLGLFTGFSWSF